MKSPRLFMEWKKYMKKHTRRKIKVLNLDNGGEYTSDPFLQLCRDAGIKRHFTVNKTLQQNGVAETMNQTLPEKIRCILLNSRLSKSFWTMYVCHLIIMLSSFAIGGKTHMEVCYGDVT